MLLKSEAGILNQKKIIRNNYLIVFGWAAIISVVIFLPFVIWDRGIFLYFGDYNVQQIPFYQHVHEMVRSGKVFWDFGTDLGANFLGSYSYYMLGSPFFWITIPFPSSFMPYLMAPLFCLKFATAAVCAFAFIKNYVKNPDFAFIGGMIYAFSGFNVYNIFFNQFNEITAFFPLMLIALDKLIQTRRRGLFALSVALMAMMNYFFFAGQAVFLVIYFFVRLFSNSYKNMHPKRIFSILFEAFLGVGLAMVVFLPAILAVAGNPRVDSFLLGMDVFVYNNSQKYLAILQSIFFPPDLAPRPNFFPEGGIKWTSLSAFLPLVSAAAVIAFFKQKKGHYLRRLLIIFLFMAMIPVLNSAFYAFNSSYYARWYYMPILLMVLVSSIVIEDAGFEKPEFDIAGGIKYAFIITAAFALIGIVPKTVNGKLKFFETPPYPERFWASVAVAMLSLLLLYLFSVLLRRHKSYTRMLLAGVTVVSVTFSAIYIFTGKQHSFDSDFIIDQAIYGAEKIDLPRNEFYRVDEYEGMDNMPMFWKFNTIRAFHTVVPSSLIEFYNSIGIKRDVSSKPDLSYYSLRSFLSTKYIFFDVKKDRNDAKIGSAVEEIKQMGFSSIGIQNGFEIFENKHFIPMGFTFDKYITTDDFQAEEKNARHKMLTSAIVLNEEQVIKYGSFMQPFGSAYHSYYTRERFFSEASDLAASSCYYFAETKRGFEAKIELDSPNLVFFSVPYDKGWKAYVDGIEVPVEKVTVGFVAVPVQAGDRHIELKFIPDGFLTGMAVTSVSAVVFTVYVWTGKRKKQDEETEEAAETAELKHETEDDFLLNQPEKDSLLSDPDDAGIDPCSNP